MADPSPLLAGRGPADRLSGWTAGSGIGRNTQCGAEREGSLERGRSGIDSVNESLVQGLEGDGHPLERGCPTGKWEKRFVMGISTTASQQRASGSCRGSRSLQPKRGWRRGDDERDGDDELLHGVLLRGVRNWLAGHVDVREAFGQNRAGEGDGERNGDDELLHRSSPKSVRSIRCPSGLARIALRTRVRWTRRAHFPNSEWL